MTVFTAIVTGFFTYVLGQIFVKLVIDPVSELKRHIGSIAHSMVEHAAPMSNLPVPKERAPELKEHFRKLSAQLEQSVHLVPLYRMTRVIFRLPTLAAIHEAVGYLIWLSNSTGETGVTENTRSMYHQQQICDLLGIYVPPARRVRADQVP